MKAVSMQFIVTFIRTSVHQARFGGKQRFCRWAMIALPAGAATSLGENPRAIAQQGDAYPAS